VGKFFISAGMKRDAWGRTGVKTKIGELKTEKRFEVGADRGRKGGGDKGVHQKGRTRRTKVWITQQEDFGASWKA